MFTVWHFVIWHLNLVLLVLKMYCWYLVCLLMWHFVNWCEPLYIFAMRHFVIWHFKCIDGKLLLLSTFTDVALCIFRNVVLCNLALIIFEYLVYFEHGTLYINMELCFVNAVCTSLCILVYDSISVHGTLYPCMSLCA